MILLVCVYFFSKITFICDLSGKEEALRVNVSVCVSCELDGLGLFA